MPPIDEVEVGQQVAARSVTLDQERLLRYAGASGDYNRLHWDAAFAAEASPTGAVIAHGMLNLGLVSALVTDWAGGPQRVLSLSVSFRAPCPVGAAVSVGAEVIALDDAKRQATLAVWAELDGGQRIIDRRRSRAVVQLA